MTSQVDRIENKINGLIYDLIRSAETDKLLANKEKIIDVLIEADKGRASEKIIKEFLTRSMELHILISYLAYRLAKNKDIKTLISDIIDIKSIKTRAGSLYLEVNIKDYTTFLYVITKLGLYDFTSAANPFSLSSVRMALASFGHTLVMELVQKAISALEAGNIEKAKVYLKRAAEIDRYMRKNFTANLMDIIDYLLGKPISAQYEKVVLGLDRSSADVLSHLYYKLRRDVITSLYRERYE